MCAKSSNKTKKEYKKFTEPNKNTRLKEKQKSNKHSTIHNCPKMPLSPFRLYFENKMASQKKTQNFDKIAFEKNCRKEWNNMADNVKLFWVNCAFEQEKMKKMLIENSNCTPIRNSCRSILTQKKTRLPKPSMEDEQKESAYDQPWFDLFRRVMLSIEEVKQLKPKEGNSYIAQLWHKYKPLDKKEYDIFFKQLLSPHNIEKFIIKKEENLSIIPEENDNNCPEIPPSCASSLFVKNYYDLYPHSDDAVQVWNMLSTEDKEVYENLLEDMKKQYIIDYQNYLEGYNVDDFYEHLVSVTE